MEPKVTVVITAYNQKDILLLCLKWLRGVYGIGNIIVIDNGSGDGTAKAISELGYDSIIFDEGVQGCGKVWNAAVDNFGLEDTVVFMNPRYMPGKQCFVRLAKALEKEGAGIAGPLSNGFRVPQYIQLDSKDILQKSEYCGDSEDKDFHVLGVEEGLWAVRKEVLQSLGAFRENLVRAENVLFDYELRMICKNDLSIVCTSAIAYDLFCGNKERNYGEMTEACDREVLKQTWKMNYFNLRLNKYLTDMVEEYRDDDFRVLEVGCDLGANLLEIKNKYPNCMVYGLEINEAAVSIAKYVADVKTGDIEQKCIPFEETFDYIIFGDVLEHLHNPQEIIKYCKEKLTEHGSIIACIPNLMHISIMQQLLNGKFQYQDTGLLDRSHIHFFTYYEILSMFQEEGFIVEEVRSVSEPLTEEQERLIGKLLELSNHVDEHMYNTFQYVVRARKQGTDYLKEDEVAGC